METKYQSILEKINSSKKYRDLELPQEMLLDIINKESNKNPSLGTFENKVRKIVHNITALYLDTVSYEEEIKNLKLISPFSNSDQLMKYCENILSQHKSTSERISYQHIFYNKLFKITGYPETIQDLACGLNPFAIPWMDLPKEINYYAYDIHKPRVEFINTFFESIGLKPLAFHQDILVTPPKIYSDVVFFFKEAHRFEKREKGCNRRFWKSINTEYLFVSLPLYDLGKTHLLLDTHRQLVERTIDGLTWKVEEVIIEDEIVFIIKK